jgi:hypothetical protein
MDSQVRPAELQWDKQGSLINLLRVTAGIYHVAAKWWHEPLCLYVVILMTLVAVLQLLHYILASMRSSFYQQHRTACTVAIQSLQLALTIKYIPAVFRVAQGSQLAAGKEAVLAGNAVLTGLATIHIAMHSAAGRLPLRHAAPFVLLKVSVSLYFLLAKQVEVLAIPPVGAAVSAMKHRVDGIYNIALAAAAVAGSWPLPELQPPPCANTCYVVWLHFCLAGLVPLYVAAVQSSSSSQGAGQQQQGRRRSASGCTSFCVILFTCARHVAVIFGISMLVWAAVDSTMYLPHVQAWIERNALCA